MKALGISLIVSLLAGCVDSGPRSEAETVGATPNPVWTPPRDNELIERFRLLDRNATWTHVATVAMQGWTTFHTQGLLKIGDFFYVSSVEVIESTVRNGTATDALHDFSIDRSTGAGRGWLTKFDAEGRLVAQVELTDGTMYHPGGIDFDGDKIWVSVAEYRPNSRSVVYRVDPESLRTEKLFVENDHIGGIVKNVHRGTLHGVSWGSRRLYTWKIRERRGGHGHRARPELEVIGSDWTPNTQFYIDYQDCHYQGVEYMLCGGVTGYASPRGSIAFGGLDLVDLRRGRPDHQVPVNRFIDEGTGPNPGLALTHNAFWAEPLGDGALRFYFMTETDNQADLLVYDTIPWINRP